VQTLIAHIPPGKNGVKHFVGVLLRALRTARSFHFTPTYSSWLDQVAIWFAKIEGKVIARGIFNSVSAPGTVPVVRKAKHDLP
jgi:hypothetical protein